jgi:hypothetical protein
MGFSVQRETDILKVAGSSEDEEGFAAVFLHAFDGSGEGDHTSDLSESSTKLSHYEVLFAEPCTNNEKDSLAAPLEASPPHRMFDSSK